MPAHAEQRSVAHPPEHLYRIVSDIEQYPEFLPWCVGARIRERRMQGDREVLIADVLISYKMFRERFRSKVTLDPGQLRVDVDYLNGPFRHLDNHWHFHREGEHTLVDFAVDFEFRSRILEKTVSGLFDRAVHKIVTAFMDRADAIPVEPVPPSS